MAKKQVTIDNFGLNNNKNETPEQEKVKNLLEQIQHHRFLYYNKTSEISDAEYDVLEDELRKLRPDHPIFQKVGVDSSELFTKKSHIIVMGSQDKVVTEEEFKKWAKKVNHNQYIVQHKLDGISIELQYKNGVFQCAISRGDSITGDDYSQNVVNMKSFVSNTKTFFTGAIRGEILLFKDVFNAKYIENENCRNATAGIVRRKDGKGSNDLTLIYYDAVSSSEDSIKFASETQKLKWLKENGFEVVKTKLFKNPNEIINYRNEIMTIHRKNLNYDIDGLVIKGNEIDEEDMKRAKPTKQIAFKFTAETYETTFLDVEWSISGHIYTPVAILEPIRIQGSTVQRASLANPNLIQGLNLKKNCRISVSKRGEIIPKVERVISTPLNTIEINIPSVCEVCNSRLINEGTKLYCPNEECPKRNYHRLVKWLNELEVKFFSEKLILTPLFEKGKIKEIADLYNLKVSDLKLLEGVKETSASKALDNLFSVKELSLEKFIAGFDIEQMGERLIKRVVDSGYNTLEKIKNSTVKELSNIKGFGEISAKTLIEGVKKLYPKMIDLLNTNQIKIKEEGKMESKKLAGLSFCFTGKLDTLKRAEAERKVVENGGETKSSVVKGLTYLVTNSTEQTTKLQDAKKKGTKIITEKEFLELLNK